MARTPAKGHVGDIGIRFFVRVPEPEPLSCSSHVLHLQKCARCNTAQWCDLHGGVTLQEVCHCTAVDNDASSTQDAPLA